jgi:hypothetical protein
VMVVPESLFALPEPQPVSAARATPPTTTGTNLWVNTMSSSLERLTYTDGQPCTFDRIP